MSEALKQLEARIEVLERRVRALGAKHDRKGPKLVTSDPGVPDVPDGYRRFVAGDVIQAGDIFVRSDGEMSMSDTIGFAPPASLHPYYFRPLQPEQTRESPLTIAMRLQSAYTIESEAWHAIGALIHDLKEKGWV